MSNVLVLYGTTEGHSASIAQRIAETLRAQGHEADVRDAGSAPVSLTPYDAAVVGSSVHMSKHDKHVVGFVKQHRDELERLPSAFFSVSLAAHGDLDEAQRYVGQFEQDTGWRPTRLVLFGGALTYTRYGFLKRRLMRRIARAKPGELGLDLSRDYDYTEWDDVDRFAQQLASELAAHAG
jgi:menaquinone-dependent protoporphyrinogen oxidase